MKEEYINLKILTPKLSKNPDEMIASSVVFQQEDVFSMKAISNCYIEGQQADHVTMKQVIFRNVDFKGAAMKFADLSDVRFENCNLSNVDFSGAIIHRTELIDCNAVGINLSESTLRNVLLQNSNGTYAYFRFSNLEQVIFRSCLMRNSDFQQSVFSKIGLEDSDFRQVQMSGTKLAGIDLGDSDIDGIGIRVEDLFGAIVSPEQAVFIAKMIGLVVK